MINVNVYTTQLMNNDKCGRLWFDFGFPRGTPLHGFRGSQYQQDATSRGMFNQ